MLKYNLYQIRRFLTVCLVSIMPYFWMMPSQVQAQTSIFNSESFSSQVFQYLASQIALQRGDISLSYQSMFNLAKNSRDPRIAQQAMEIALAAQSPEASLESAKLWDELTPDADTNSKEVLITLLMFNNKWNESVQPTIKLLKTKTVAERDDFLTKLLPILARSTNQDQSTVALAKIINAFKPLPKDTNILFLYSLGEDKLGHYDNMEKVLRSIIQQKPNDSSALNALGYSFADRNIHLQESFNLIQEALKYAPNDPYIIDSLGWIYYRLGQYDVAITQLKQSFELLPEAEVGAHLGEVLWVNGQKEDALNVWRKAESINASQSTLRETLQRLKPDWSSTEVFDSTVSRRWDGRFAIKVNGKSSQNGGNGAFYLSHENLSDNLEIRGPLGSSIAKINITPSKATLEQNGKLVTAMDADQLIQQATGLPIPGRGLSAWLSGYARPGSPGTVKRNENGQVVEISQDGWLLNYSWGSNNKLQKINMNRSGQEGDIEIRLIIDQAND